MRFPANHDKIIHIIIIIFIINMGATRLINANCKISVKILTIGRNIVPNAKSIKVKGIKSGGGKVMLYDTAVSKMNIDNINTVKDSA